MNQLNLALIERKPLFSVLSNAAAAEMYMYTIGKENHE